MIIVLFLKNAMNIENVVITIKNLQMNQILALDNVYGVDILLNKFD